MARFAAKRTLCVLATGAIGVVYAGCGGSAGAPRDGGAAGTPAAGGTGATGGTGGSTGGTGGSTGGTGAAGAATGGGAGMAADACSGVGANKLIVDFDEGATVVERNYPITKGAMPGGTYSYSDPMDTTVVYGATVIDGGHMCKALSLTITGTSWRGIGLWSTASVDATAYTGVTFWAKRGASSTDPATLTVSLGMDAVTMAGTGTGTCPGTTDAGCVRPQAVISLTTTWTQFSLYWGTFTPGSADGTPVPASGAGVNGLDMSFSSSSTGTTTMTEVDLDDVAFLTSAAPATGGTGGMGGMGSSGTAGMSTGGMPGSAGSAAGAGGVAAGAGGVAAGAGGAAAGSPAAGAGGAAAGNPGAGAGGVAAGAGGTSAGAGGRGNAGMAGT